MTIVLETERLLFRRLVPDDLDDLFALYRDPEIRRHFPEGTLTYEETRDELEFFLNGHPDHPELGLWATVCKENDRFIGRCGLLPWTIGQRQEVEVAYLLAKEVLGARAGDRGGAGYRPLRCRAAGPVAAGLPRHSRESSIGERGSHYRHDPRSRDGG